MNKKEQEIQSKLLELESTVLKESTELSVAEKNTDLLSQKNKGKASGSADDTVTKSDSAYFGGLGLIVLGLVILFQHIHVSNSFLAMLLGGGGSFLVVFLPLMIGIGMMIYNSRNKWGWVVTAGSSVVLVLSVLAGLQMRLDSMSLLQMIMLFLPFAIGGSLLVKGMGGPKGVMQTVKHNLPKKPDNE